MRGHSALLSVLVKRWKLETHTFHLSVSEVIVTLEDVTYIFGLPVNGEPVTRRSNSSHQFLVENCIAFSGREPSPQDHVLGKVNLAWVRQCKDTEPCDMQESIERYVRDHIFYMLRTVVFSNKSTTSLNSMFLRLTGPQNHDRRARNIQWVTLWISSYYSTLQIGEDIVDFHPLQVYFDCYTQHYGDHLRLSDRVAGGEADANEPYDQQEEVAESQEPNPPHE
ncbi:hypothetical protein Ahy_A10g048540 [Arachis hypogaea]|uniref:Aminotransferase-like plant mobile domain-containing protein n=1 Tax=Arachis hypogaea TaxID=3818 RepID=A0A445B5B2_ARAHY|nr:hypothetical protein Ahy_A10g048540 [Arachis hypogaea]